MKKQLDPWQIIEALSTTEATRFEWRWRLGVFYEAMAPHLRPVHMLDSIGAYCPECAKPAMVLREPRGDHHFLCHDDPTPCEYTATLTADDSTVLRVNFRSLADAIAELLNLSAPSLDDARSATCLVGSLSRPQRMPVFLLMAPDANTCYSQASEILTKQKTPVVFLTLSPHSRLPNLLSLPEVYVVDLPSLFTWSPDGLVGSDTNLAQIIGRIAFLKSLSPLPEYAIKRGAGCWLVIYDGEELSVSESKGMDYVEYLLHGVPSDPVYAPILISRTNPCSRESSDIIPTDSTSVVGVSRDAVIQERSLSTENFIRIKELGRDCKKAKAIIDDPDSNERERSDAETDYDNAMAEILSLSKTTRSQAEKDADAIRKAISRLVDTLRKVPTSAECHTPATSFAQFIENHIVTPSSRYGRSFRFKKADYTACSFLYEPPTGVTWN